MFSEFVFELIVFRIKILLENVFFSLLEFDLNSHQLVSSLTEDSDTFRQNKHIFSSHNAKETAK